MISNSVKLRVTLRSFSKTVQRSRLARLHYCLLSILCTKSNLQHTDSIWAVESRIPFLWRRAFCWMFRNSFEISGLTSRCMTDKPTDFGSGTIAKIWVVLSYPHLAFS
jgi:hypothetical protein